MTDLYQGPKAGKDDPAEFAAAVTPNDSTDLGFATRAIYVGVSGNLVVDMVGGGTVTFTGAPIGILPIRATRVRATGTTATDIVALW